MTPEEVAAFLASGRNAVTAFAQAEEMLNKYGDAFDVRGGAPVYGDDALQIVTLSNAIQQFLTPQWLAIINKYRMDV